MAGDGDWFSALVVGNVWICAMLNENFDHSGVTAFDGEHEWGDAISVLEVGVE